MRFVADLFIFHSGERIKKNPDSLPNSKFNSKVTVYVLTRPKIVSLSTAVPFMN